MKTLQLISLLVLLQYLCIVHAQIDVGEMTLEHIYKNHLFDEFGITGLRSMKDGQHYTTLEDETRIVKFSYETGEQVDILFSVDEDSDNKIDRIDEYEFNNKEDKILLATNQEMIYRNSFYADYYVYDIPSKSLMPLTRPGKVRLASFSPDNLKVAFIRDNNIYIKDLTSEQQTQITFDGKVNEIINGAVDWVYEEEFRLLRGYEWSPDGNNIAYYKFDESRVKEFSMTMYEDLYPQEYRFKYPKAGEDNSIVTIHVYDLGTGETRQINTGSETDQYIPRIKWTKNPDKLSIFRLNRHQNRFDLLFENVKTGTSSLILGEKNEFYISELTDNQITYFEDGKHFIYLSEAEGYFHFYLYDMKGNMIRQITSGEWDVIDFHGYDENSGTLYYSSYENSSIQKDVYAIRIDGTGKRKISQKPGWNNIEFSKGFNYFINTYSNANTPGYITLHNNKGRLIRILEDNAFLIRMMQAFDFSKKEFITVTTSEGINLNAFMIKPSDFDNGKKYPLLMYVYGGPESQEVRDSWNRRNAWFQYLTKKGFIIACVDNRGTNGRGELFRKATYMQLGNLETKDQTEAAKYFGSLPYIDEHRIGIFGSSYGGYMSSLCMTTGADYFRVGVAVAPVTSWRFYDSIYTERFMRTPQENPGGYDDNSPVNHAQKLKGKFLLIHGMFDDNVHMQNSVELAKALVVAGKQFDMHFYPGQSHYFRDPNARFHLYFKITEYFLENL